MKKRGKLFDSDPNLSSHQFSGNVGSGIAMERSVDEKQKFPDRINLDRRGLHGILLFQTINSLTKLDQLKKLHTVQMEGNPVWSCSEYTFHLVSSLESLKMLDQQEITLDVRSYAEKWLKNKNEPINTSSNNTPANSVVGGGTARKQLLKKMEERNFSISNAKMRWSFLKKQAIPVVKFLPDKKLLTPKEDTASLTDSQITVKPSSESEDVKVQSPPKSIETSNPPSRIMSRQASRNSLVSSNKLQVPSNNRSSNPGSPNKHKNSKSEFDNLKAISMSGMLQRFLEFENRHFVLQQRFISMSQELGSFDSNPSDSKTLIQSNKGFRSRNRKIGFFTAPEFLINHNMDSSNEEICGFVSDSSSGSSSSEASSSDDNLEEDGRSIFPLANRSSCGRGKKVPECSSKYISFRRDAFTRHAPSPSLASASSVRASSPSHSAMSPCISDSDIGIGRTSEQGRDYLIELDGDLLAVYGHQSLKFLDRPWNKNRAAKATTVQFNFVSFDELIPYMAKFRITFPNVIHFRFEETGLHCLGQLNALAYLQGITSLQIEGDGNPIIFKSQWKLYAIYRLEHWGLRIINDEEITEKNIILANKMYGCLGEMAFLVTPHSIMTNITKKLDMFLPFSTKEELAFIDKNPVLKEIMVKESLQYKPSNQGEVAKRKNLKIISDLTDITHSAFHKFGRFEDEWLGILPILIKRIVSQFSDIRQYKKESLCRLQRSEIIN